MVATVRQLCTPREGAFDLSVGDQIDRLDQVLASSEAQADEFFAKNHVTAGLKVLLSQGLSRLAGRSDRPLYELRQAMGGGKTHSMVALGLLARKLIDIDPRHAWQNEARHFTPWLAAHLDELGEVLGIPLEMTGTEVPVEGFAADILARNLHDGSVVLIENQLEKTDHSHLGQILTYLAGLEAKTIVWIATDFREPHLSAIKRLNDHTAEDFNFFAIRLRVVRISESLPAPIFGVLIRPNLWERHLQAATKNSQENSEVGNFRREFWTAYLARFPDDKSLGVEVTGTSSVWLPVDAEGSTIVSLWVGRTKVGLFVRGPRGSDGTELADRLDPLRQHLEQKLGAKYGRTTGANFFDRSIRFDMSNRANWQTAID